MVALGVPVKAVQERLGHSRPDILLNYYVHVLEESAEQAAAALSTRLTGGFSVPDSPKNGRSQNLNSSKKMRIPSYLFGNKSDSGRFLKTRSEVSHKGFADLPSFVGPFEECCTGILGPAATDRLDTARHHLASSLIALATPSWNPE